MTGGPSTLACLLPSHQPPFKWSSSGLQVLPRCCQRVLHDCTRLCNFLFIFLWTALQRENNISQASLNAHTFGNYRPVICDEGREWGYQNEQFYGSRLFTSNERAIIARIRWRSARWEWKKPVGPLERSPCQIHCTCHHFAADCDVNDLWRVSGWDW